MMILLIVAGAALCVGAGYVARWGVEMWCEDRELTKQDARIDAWIEAEDRIEEVPWCPPCQQVGHVLADHSDPYDLGEITRVNGGLIETWRHECPPAALSGPQDPDIDTVPPFGDPPDDDDADDDSGPPRPTDDQAPSLAEVAWAEDNLIRDRQDPRYYMPENQHAMRILGWGGGQLAAPDRYLAEGLAARDWDDLLAAVRAGMAVAL